MPTQYAYFGTRLCRFIFVFWYKALQILFVFSGRSAVQSFEMKFCNSIIVLQFSDIFSLVKHYRVLRTASYSSCILRASIGWYLFSLGCLPMSFLVVGWCSSGSTSECVWFNFNLMSYFGADCCW